MTYEKFIKKWTAYNNLVTWMCLMTFVRTSVNLTCLTCVLLETMYVHTHTNVYLLYCSLFVFLLLLFFFFVCLFEGFFVVVFVVAMMTNMICITSHNISWIKTCLRKRRGEKNNNSGKLNLQQYPPHEKGKWRGGVRNILVPPQIRLGVEKRTASYQRK